MRSNLGPNPCIERASSGLRPLLALISNVQPRRVS
jgi:hypothetical protein